jgi:hypothetical protein
MDFFAQFLPHACIEEIEVPSSGDPIMRVKCLNRTCPDVKECARPVYDSTSLAYLSRTVNAARQWDCFVPREKPEEEQK